MTMADTIAVMNQGRIEQLGGPQEIYDTPVTVFAANFLGQSNLVPGRIVERGEQVVVEAFGHRIRLPRDRMKAQGDQAIVGVRPEKLRLHQTADGVPAGHNSMTGIVTDVSFVGVSTQYLVLAPWGQELIAFELNSSSADRPIRGDTVTVSWEPGHTFGLDGGEDLNAGVSRDLREVGAYTAADVAAGVVPTPVLPGKD